MEELEKLISELFALTELSLHDSGNIEEDEKIANILITPNTDPGVATKFILRFNTNKDTTIPIFIDNETLSQINTINDGPENN